MTSSAERAADAQELAQLKAERERMAEWMEKEHNRGIAIEVENMKTEHNPRGNPRGEAFGAAISETTNNFRNEFNLYPAKKSLSASTTATEDDA